MEVKSFKDIRLSRLGLGNMRLPQLKPGFGGAIDREKAREVIEYAYQNGINYFDTAYVYHNGESEAFLGEVLGQYERSSYYLADKFYIPASEDYEAMFADQLKRLNTDYIDFYLLHGVEDNNAEKYLNGGSIEFFNRMKEEGKIHYFGFSSHASPEVLKKVLDANTWDFVQIQCNYYDWKFSSTAEEYRILSERNIPVMVMEPIRGGKLAELSEEPIKLFRENAPKRSNAAWALNWVRRLPGVQVILSGMSSFEQIKENVSIFESENDLTAADEEICAKAAQLFKKEVSVPCTACRYCCGTCPAKIEIPEYMALYNKVKTDGPMSVVGFVSSGEGVPSDCVGCGQCKERCPQGIDVPAVMKELADVFESMKDIK